MKKELGTFFLIVGIVALSFFGILKITGNVVSSVDQNAINIYVSPVGNDAWTGGYPSPDGDKGPLKTLTAARAKIRQLKVDQQLNKNVNVYLRGGTYFLNEPFTLDERDSGTTSVRVTYSSFPGETALISGGKRLENNNWQLYSGNIYSMHVDSNFSSLFLGFDRLTRARSPDIGSYTGTASASSADKKYAFNFASGNINSNWKNLKDVEIASIIKWEQNRFKINYVSGNKVVLSGGMETRWGNSFAEDYAAGSFRYYVDNVFEGLDSAGEWYLDKSTSTLYYWPRNAQELSSGIFIVPILTKLVDINGKPNNYVKNLSFENLIFAHTDWTLNPSGYKGSQAGLYIYGPSAIIFNYTNNSQFVNNTVTLTGAVGLESNSGNLNVSGNEFFNLGAGAIKEGKEDKFTDGSSWPAAMLPELDVAVRNTISNNKIHDIGKVFREGVGIWVGLSGYNTIENNLIYNGGYSGISVGWKWGISDTRAKYNVIQRNIIHDVMQELNDGAGIYTLGKQVGTVIKFNFVSNIIKTSAHSFSGCDYCIQGLHMDEGSSAMVVHNNVFSNTFNGMVLNVGSGNDIHDNIFAYQSNYIVFWNQLRTTVGYNRFRANSYYGSPSGTKYSTAADDATFSEYSLTRFNSAPSTTPTADVGPQYGVSVNLANMNSIFTSTPLCLDSFWNSCPEVVNPPIVTPPVISTTCTSFTYSDWNVCSSDSIKTRSVTGSSPASCVGGSPQTSESCVYNSVSCMSINWDYVDSECLASNTKLRTWTKIGVCDETSGVVKPSSETVVCNYSSPVCNSFSYSDWSNCSFSGAQSRNISARLPSNCAGGNPVLVQSCTYSNPSAPASLVVNPPQPTLSNVATEYNAPNFITRLKCRLFNLFNLSGYSSCLKG